MKYKFILHTPLQVRDTPDGLCGRSEMAMRLVDFVPVLVTVRLPILLKRHDIGVPMAHTAQCSQLFAARSDRNQLPFEHHGLQAMVTVKMCVHAAHHQIVVTVLQVQHPVGNGMVVVIVDKAHAGHALTLVRAYVREGVTAQTLADQVTHCFGAVVIAMRSLSEILCVRHSMSTTSMNATLDEDDRSDGQGGAAAILSRAA